MLFLKRELNIFTEQIANKLLPIGKD